MSSISVQEKAYEHRIVDGRPYFQFLNADSEDPSSIFEVASQIVYFSSLSSLDKFSMKNLSLSKVVGGITNSLFRVDGFPSPYPNSVLVRIFGAEGMIDRDRECSILASLCDDKIASGFLGRFGNGRVEEWLYGYRPLKNTELGTKANVIASQLSMLHVNFKPNVCCKEATLWNQIFSWYDEALNKISQNKFLNVEADCLKAEELFEEFNVKEQLHLLKESIPKSAKTCFCHNDLLAANIMFNEKTNSIQLIDFEYGGMNYLSFDIANHFNEYAGGTDDAKPDYKLFPTKNEKEFFIKSYISHYETFSSNVGVKMNLQDLINEVDTFISVNHLYWSLWAINQAADEGCDEFNYLLYAENRFKRYKETMLEERS